MCAQSCPTLCDPMDYNLPGSSLSMGFLRQEYLSGLPLPSPGDLLNPRIEPTSVASPALTDIGEAITKYQVPQAEWLQQQKFIFLQFWRLEAQGQGVGNVGFILRPFSLTCRQTPSSCVLTRPFVYLHASLISLCVSKFPPFIRTPGTWG